MSEFKEEKEEEITTLNKKRLSYERWVMVTAIKNNRTFVFAEEQPPDEWCMSSFSFKQSDREFILFKKRTLEVCLNAVNHNGLLLALVPNQTPEICLAAVKQNGRAIMHVQEQTPEVCLAAVKQNPHVLAFIFNQTLEMCMIAVQKKANTIFIINLFTCLLL